MDTSTLTLAEVETDVLAALMRARIPMTVLDARSPRPGAERIPGARYLSPEASDDVIARVLPDKSALIVTYCGGPQCSLSVHLADRLRTLGYENVLEYRPGFEGWRQAGHSVEQLDPTYE